MKKLFSILFIVGAIFSFAIGNVEGTAIACTGLVLTLAAPKLPGHAFLQIVPGKFVVTETNRNSPNYGTPVEVPYMSRSEKALFDQLITLGRANPVTQRIIDQGGISFDPITYYIRADISGGAGRQAVVDNSIIQFVGVTNIPNGAALPQFYNFCFDKIAIRYATTNSANANVAAMTGWSSIRSSMPAALGNGHLIVTSNQNKILETPVADFTSVAAITGGGERDYDGGALEKPRFFLELINIGVDLNYAQGQAVPSNANNTFAVEIMFYGVQARLKA